MYIPNTHAHTHTHSSLPVSYPRFCAGHARLPHLFFFFFFDGVPPNDSSRFPLCYTILSISLSLCLSVSLSLPVFACLPVCLSVCLSVCLPLPFFAPAFWPACGLHPPPLFFIRFFFFASLSCLGIYIHTYRQAGRQAGMHTYTHRYIHARTHAYIPWSLDVIVDSVGVSSPPLVDSRCMHACVRACVLA